jgi:hypothetical protein
MLAGAGLLLGVAGAVLGCLGLVHPEWAAW